MPEPMSSPPTSGFASAIADNSHTDCTCVSLARQLCHGSSHGPLASVCGTIWGTFHTFPQRIPSKIEPCCSQSNQLLNAPLVASCLLCLTFPTCSPVLPETIFQKFPPPSSRLRVCCERTAHKVSTSPQACCGHQGRIIKLSLSGCLFKQGTGKQVGG